MKHWLVKSEPDVYGWLDLVRDGATRWDGVRNHMAAGHLKAMRAGDPVFVYHSNAGKAVVGVARVTREAYPDPTDATGKFVAVDLEPVAPLPAPVALATIKVDPRLAEMVLVKNSRLSVQPVTPAEWAIIEAMASG